jgi:DNA polymerase elongation subunit (family B)
VYLNIFHERPEDGRYGGGLVHVWDDQIGYKKLPYKRYAYKLNDKGKYTSLFGQPLKIVYGWKKSDEEKGLIFEGDVNPEMRYLIDNYISSDEPSKSHITMYLDIEVESTNQLPNPELAENKVTAISYYNTSNNEYDVLILDESYELSNEQLDWKDNSTVNVWRYDDEATLLKKFMVDYKKIGPTIITGWNIDYFDIPYLYNRIKNVLSENVAKMLSPIGITKHNPFRKRYFLAGVSCLDYLSLYKNFVTGEKESYKLDSIAKKELGRGKVEFDGTLTTMFKTNKKLFIEYNLTDTELVKSLDDKLKFIELTKGICHKGHVPLEDVYFSSRFLDGAILTYMKRNNLVASNRPVRDGDSDMITGEVGFTGAYVKDPIPGKYPWLIDLDFTSLYPSIIMSLNISPETKVCRVEKWNGNDFAAGIEKNYIVPLDSKSLTLNKDKMKEFLIDNNFSIASNGVMYSNANRGIIPEILEVWFNERVEYRRLQKKAGDENDKVKFEFFKARQIIQKIILNSLYGVLGLPTFRFYDLDNAEAVTTTGVEAIKFSEKVVNIYFKKAAEIEGDNVIYMDTDSLFISLLNIVLYKYPDTDVENDEDMIPKMLEVARDIQDFINKYMNYFSEFCLNVKNHRFNMKQELIAKRGFWTTKKRYALKVVNSEGFAVDKMEVKGLDVIRTSFPKVFREFMKIILNDILTDVDKETINTKILQLRKDMNTTSISNIARPTSIKEISKYTDNSHQPFTRLEKGCPVHVNAAIRYNDFIRYNQLENKYALIGNGEKIKWVYLKQNPYCLSVLAFRDNDEDPPVINEYISEYIDRKAIFEAEISTKLSDFYTALNWGSLPTKSNQNLSKFI